MSKINHELQLYLDSAESHAAANEQEKAIEYLLRASLISPSGERLVLLFNSLMGQLPAGKFEELAYEQIRNITMREKASQEDKVSRVTLVQAPRWNINQPALAIGVLTGCLRAKGFSVNPLDFDIDLYNSVNDTDKIYWDDANEDFWLKTEKVVNLFDEYPAFIYFCLMNILKNNPQVIGFSVQTKSKQISLMLAEKINKIAPDKYIILGGPETSQGPDIMLAPYNYVDAIFLGEADISFPDFLMSLNPFTKDAKPTSGVIFRNSEGSLVESGSIVVLPKSADIPLSDFSDIDFSKYRVPNSVNLIMSRGCINRCSFCNESPVFKKFRAYGAERAYQEILNVIKNTNIGESPRICYNDSLLNGNLEELDAFCDLLIEKPIEGLTFSGMMLIRSQMTDELVEKLAKAKFIEVFFGVENGCDEVLKIMKKNYNTADVERVIKQMHKHGIRVTAFIMVGHPGETEPLFYKSLNFIRKLAPHITMISFNLTQILENSDIKKHPSKYNVTNTDTISWSSDSGSNTLEVRKQRQLLARTLLGDKAYGMGCFEDPMDQESKSYYSQGRILHARYVKCTQKIKEYVHHIKKMESELRRNGLPVPLAPAMLNFESPMKFPEAFLKNWQEINNQYKQTVVYGAGKFTSALITALEEQSMPLPKIIWDDSPHANELHNVPVEKTPDVFPPDIDAIVIGSDTYQTKMSLRLRQIAGELPFIIDLTSLKYK